MIKGPRLPLYPFIGKEGKGSFSIFQPSFSKSSQANFSLMKINPFAPVSIRLYVEIANPLKDIVHGNVKCFPPSRRDKSSLVKSTVSPKKESSLRRRHFPAGIRHQPLHHQYRLPRSEGTVRQIREYEGGVDPDTLWPSGQAYHNCGRCLPFQRCWTAGSDQEAQKSSAESVL